MPKKWPSRQLGICHSVYFYRNCRGFRLAVKSSNIVLFMVSYILITGYSILLFMNPLNFVAVILKVLLVYLLAALNFPTFFK